MLADLLMILNLFKDSNSATKHFFFFFNVAFNGSIPSIWWTISLKPCSLLNGCFYFWSPVTGMCFYETVVMFFRHRKCKACYKQLKNLSNVVKNRAEQVGRHGSTFKELQLLMAPLDYWHTRAHTHRETLLNLRTQSSVRKSQQWAKHWARWLNDTLTRVCLYVRS